MNSYISLYFSMNCPKCKSSSHGKNGVVNGRQLYKCHDCGYNYSVEIKSKAGSPFVKKQALQLYLKGLGFHSIGRILEVNHGWDAHLHREQKNTAGSGLLLTELGKNSSVDLLAAEEQKPDKNSGNT